MLRSGLAAVLLVVFVSVAVAANTSTWAQRTVLDADVFAATVERSLEAPAVEELVAAEIAEATMEGLADLPPQVVDDVAAQVLDLPPGSGDARIEAALADHILGHLRTPAVREVRQELVGAVHGVIVGAPDAAGPVRVRGTDVVVDVDRVIDRVSSATGPEVAAVIRQAGFADDGPIVIAQVADLRPIQDTLVVLRALDVIVPLLAIAVALLIVVVAHRRVRALGIVGLAVAGAGLISMAVIWLAGQYVSRVPETALSRDIADEVFDAFLAVLRDQAIALVVVGVAIGVVAWYVQRHRHRRAVRRLLGPRQHSAAG